MTRQSPREAEEQVPPVEVVGSPYHHMVADLVIGSQREYNRPRVCKGCLPSEQESTFVGVHKEYSLVRALGERVVWE